MSDNNQNNAGFLVGLLMGAIGTLLLSPKSGEEVRKDIRKFAEDKSTAIKDDITEKKEQLQDGLAKIEDNLSEKSEDMKDSAEKVVSKAKSKVQDNYSN